MYITWKNAFIGLVALTASTGTVLAWEATEHKQFITRVEYQSMQDDIKIIKACLIQKKCGG